MRRTALVAIVLSGNLIFRVAAAEIAENASLLSKENVVDVASGGGSWTSASVGQALAVRDRLRTGEDSRAAVRMTDLSVLRVDEFTETEILAPRMGSAKPTLNLKQGSAYFFSREQAGEVQLETPAANGAIRGTEFAATVDRKSVV